MTAEDVHVQTEPKTSRWAIASFVCGIISIFCLLLPVFGPLAIIFGIIALIQLNPRNPYLKGKNLAVAGIGIPIGLAFAVVILMPMMGRVGKVPLQAVCRSQMRALGTALTVYVNDYDEQLPPENWCDLLILEADVAPKSVICPSSEEIEGECSYAMNRFAADKKLDELPAGIVLLFETSIGLKDSPRTTPAELRRFYSAEALGYTASHKVRKDRWNQYGGPGDVLIRHDESKPAGANFLFADGHAEFVPADKISTLKWITE